MKRLFLYTICVLSASIVNAQTTNVHLKDGTAIKINSSSVSNTKFINDSEESKAIIQYYNGETATYTKDEFDYFDFSTNTEVKAKEYEALIALYNSTNGDKWTYNNNWGSDKPLNEWYGITVDENGHISQLNLMNNNLSGSLPQNIGDLLYLNALFLGNNHLTGSIPSSIKNLASLQTLNLRVNNWSGSMEAIGGLTNLKRLFIDYCQLSDFPEWVRNLQNLSSLSLDGNKIKGKIPEWLGELTSLEYLNLSENEFTEIPASLGNLVLLKDLYLYYNKLTGDIPENLKNLKRLEKFGIDHNEFTCEIPEWIGELTNLTRMDFYWCNFYGSIPESIGNLKNLKELYLMQNNLSGTLPESLGNLSNLEILYVGYNNIEGNIPETFAKLENLKSLSLKDNRMSGVIPEVVTNSAMWQNLTYDIEQQEGYSLIVEKYESTDFSKDGEVTVLQKHTKGKGIHLVITGSGYSDRLIADGTYMEHIKNAQNAFFAKEPFTSFKDYFDVYLVTAVSKNELINGDIAFDVKASDGCRLVFSPDLIAEYVKKVPQLNNSLKDVTTLLVINHNHDAMWFEHHTMFFNDGFAIGETSQGTSMEHLVQHEAGGHAFGKLDDEYVSGEEVFPSEYYEDLDMQHREGYYLNVDYHSSPDEVLWKDFIKNDDYKIERIGIWEGAGAGFKKGLYRPTYASIMNSGGEWEEFNAPSRWAIYKRIMELAGESCKFEDFLEYDKKNLEAMKAKKARQRSASNKQENTGCAIHSCARPIIYDYPSTEIGKHQ